MTVFLTDIDDRAAVNTVRQEVFGATRPASTLVEVSRLAIPGARIEVEAVASCRERSVQRDHHDRRAGRCAAGAVARAPPARQGPDRHRGHPHDVRVEDLRRPRPDAHRDGGRTARRGRSRRRRQGQPARVRLGRDEPERLVRHRPEPAAPGPHDRRLVGRECGGARGGPLRHRHRHRHGLLDPPARVVLRRRRPQAELGAGPGGRRVPALPQLRHRRADGDQRPGGGGDVVGARGGAAPGAAARRADGRAADAAAVRGRPGAGREPRGRGVRRAARGSSARTSSRRRSPTRPPTPGRSSSTRPPRRTAPRSPSAPTSTARTSAPSSSRRRRSTRRRSQRAAAAVRAWRTYRPEVDLYVAPVLGVDVPPVDCDELDIRIPATAFLRPFNVLGWAAIAIGDLQFIAPRDEIGARRGARLGASARLRADVLDLARGRQRQVDLRAEAPSTSCRRSSCVPCGVA